MGAQQNTKIDQIIAWINRSDYYQILNVAQNVNSVRLKEAYFALSQQYHPDKFFSKADADTKTKITTVFKRVNEAYTVLRDPRKRKRYDANLASGDRQNFLRYNFAEDDREGPANPEDQAKTPNGKKYLKMALSAKAKKDWNKVEQNIKFALGFEPENEAMKKLLNVAQAEIKKAPKENPFKIK